MRQLLTLSVLIVATWSVSAQDKKDEKKDDKKAEAFDAKKLEGTWTFVSGMKAGQKSGDDVKKNEVVFKGNEMTMTIGDMKFVLKMTINDKKTPIEVDFEITDGPIGKGDIAKGIIELTGDELKVCYPNMGMGDRPAKFDGEKNFFFVLKKKAAK